jgi:hypothetical protein
MLQAPPTILEQVTAISGFIIRFGMSSAWQVVENSFFAGAAMRFMAHRGDDFNGCLTASCGRRCRGAIR